MGKFMVLVVLVILIWSCQKDSPEPHQYVFLELRQSYYVEILEGECEPIYTYDYDAELCKGYWYDPSKKLIRDYCDDVDINESLELIVGYNGLHGIYNLPFVYEDNFLAHAGHSVKIESIDPDGTLYFYYKDALKSLNPNEEFIDVYSEKGNGLEYRDLVLVEQFEDSCLVKTTFTTRLVNHGLFDRSNYKYGDS